MRVKQTIMERRRHSRSRHAQGRQVRLSFEGRPGVAQVILARLLDLNESGCRLTFPLAFRPGALASLTGVDLQLTVDLRPMRATVRWCAAVRNGEYQIGLEFSEPARVRLDDSSAGAGASEIRGSGEDLYEILQVSPNAEPETIHRVYRILAQRYHPDNPTTGNDSMFRSILSAYRTLSDPSSRAAYDATYSRVQSQRWRIFDSAEVSTGIEAEKRKRNGILALLYAKRMRQPEQAGMTLQELEQLLGIPREHLQFAIWYLREQGLVERADNGRCAITARGVEQAEQTPPPTQPALPLLGEASRAANL